MSFCTCRLYSNLNFGKYIGRKVIDIIEIDPQYLIWAFENTNCHPTQEVIDILLSKGYKIKLNNKAKKRLKECKIIE
jgi:uncharacterized protein (DUF3820 family)